MAWRPVTTHVVRQIPRYCRSFKPRQARTTRVSIICVLRRSWRVTGALNSHFFHFFRFNPDKRTSACLSELNPQKHGEQKHKESTNEDSKQQHETREYCQIPGICSRACYELCSSQHRPPGSPPWFLLFSWNLKWSPAAFWMTRTRSTHAVCRLTTPCITDGITHGGTPAEPCARL